MRVERHKIIDKEVEGWYKIKYYCSKCNELIAETCHDTNYRFGTSTILKTNKLPNNCPHCGKKLEGDFCD